MPVCKQCDPVHDRGKVCPHYGPEVHGILLDLITDLRALHRPHDAVYEDEDPWCVSCALGWDGGDFDLIQWPCDTAQVFDRAEARLTGLNDE